MKKGTPKTAASAVRRLNICIILKTLCVRLLRNTAIVCKDSNRHPHGCREQQCSYYRKAADTLIRPVRTESGLFPVHHTDK
jgi:hypothetical protein